MAKQSLNTLSDETIEILKEIVKDWRTRRDPIRSELSRISQAAEVFIALPPTNGIPALSRTGSTAGAGDTPGSAECNIHQILSGVVSDAGFTRVVYNLTGSHIDQDWLTVVKDKFGDFVVPAQVPPLSRGVLYTALSYGGTAVVECEEFNVGLDTWLRTGEVVTVRLGLPSSTSLAIGTIVWYTQRYGKYWVLLAECDPVGTGT